MDACTISSDLFLEAFVVNVITMRDSIYRTVERIVCITRSTCINL